MCLKRKPTQQPKSPLVFFFNLCFLLFCVPFRTKWSPHCCRYIITHYKLHRFICALFHLVIIHLHIFTVDNHFQNFSKLSGSLISTIFRTVSRLATTLSCFLFIKMVWFIERRRVEEFVNFTASTKMTTLYFNFSRLLILFPFIFFPILNYKVALETYRLGLIVDLKYDSTFFYSFMGMCSRTEIGGLIWKIVHCHTLISYSFNHNFLFCLSTSMIGMTLDLENSLKVLPNTEIQKVSSCHLNINCN